METLNTTDTKKEILKLEEELIEKKRQLAELRKKLTPKEVSDYTFTDIHGKSIKLSDFFGSNKELILIHNMGKSCPYCTLWADEYNGVVKHLENRAPFLVISPDEYPIMKEFAESRNWKFKIYSSKGNTFKKDMGFENEKGVPQPGVTVFIKNEKGEIFEYSQTYFGPGDNYCSVWDYFDLLPQGSNGWHPKYKY